MGVFFNLYGDGAAFSLLGFAAMFIGAVFLNEVTRRTKIWGIIVFIAIPCVLLIYFAAVNVMASMGVAWALKNYTYVYKNDWYDYLKLFIAVLGVIGFMALRHGVGIGARWWFKFLPFVFMAAQLVVCVGIELYIAVAGDKSFRYTGWWDFVNAMAGFLNIFCFTGRGHTYVSAKKQDALCPNLTKRYIVAFSLWYFTFMYSCSPAESWYGGLVVILAAAFSNALFNKGGWAQNYAQILTLWYMFSAVVPVARSSSAFYTTPSYLSTADMSVMGVLALVSFAVNAFVFTTVVSRGVKCGVNPFENEIFIDSPYYRAVMARRETDGKMPE